MDTETLLRELTPTVEDNLNRHLGVAQEWMPHEYVPWKEGRNFALLDGEPWSVEQSTLSSIARTALEVNLLTEDNLPSYHREVDRAFGRESAWGEWVNRWTAEEGRHAFCIRDYLLVTRGVDPDELERARMQTMETGYYTAEKSLLRHVVRDIATTHASWGFHRPGAFEAAASVPKPCESGDARGIVCRQKSPWCRESSSTDATPAR